MCIVGPAHLLGTQNAAEALRLLAPGACMGADLDEHVGLRDVDGVVAHLAQEHCAHLQSERTDCILCHMCPGIKQPAVHHGFGQKPQQSQPVGLQ